MPPFRQLYARITFVNDIEAPSVDSALYEREYPPEALKARARTTWRHRRAYELQLQGLTYAEIARKLDYADSSSVRRALESYAPTLDAASIENRRAVELAKLDRQYRKLQPLAFAANKADVDKDAHRLMIAIHDRIVRLLGLSGTSPQDDIDEDELRREATAAGLDPDELVASAQAYVRNSRKRR